MSSDDVNKGRRRFLVATTTVVGGVGAGIAAVPFIKSWMPSARAQALPSPRAAPVISATFPDKLKFGYSMFSFMN